MQARDAERKAPTGAGCPDWSDRMTDQGQIIMLHCREWIIEVMQ